MAERRGSSPISGEAPRGAGGVPPPACLWTSGRECWVFRADDPEQLCGHHPELIRSALLAGESVRYLLYSPIFDAGGGPFRVGGMPGSHAVAITERRLLVSHDPHADGRSRSVLAIELESISCIDLGCALAMGWFVVHHAAPRAATCPILFGAHGSTHFRSVVRAYLGQTGKQPDRETSGGWSAAWEGVAPYLRAEAEPLLDGATGPLAVVRVSERWSQQRRLWRWVPVCVSAPGVLVATAQAIVWAASEPRRAPDALAFGVNVTVVRPDRVVDVRVRPGREAESVAAVLQLTAGAGRSLRLLEIPFDPEDAEAARQVVRLAAAWGATR